MALYTGWTFFHIDLLQKLYRCLFEKTEKTKASQGLANFLKKLFMASGPGLNR